MPKQAVLRFEVRGREFCAGHGVAAMKCSGALVGRKRGEVGVDDEAPADVVGEGADGAFLERGHPYAALIVLFLYVARDERGAHGAEDETETVVGVATTPEKTSLQCSELCAPLLNEALESRRVVGGERGFASVGSKPNGLVQAAADGGCNVGNVRATHVGDKFGDEAESVAFADAHDGEKEGGPELPRIKAELPKPDAPVGGDGVQVLAALLC